VASVSPCTGLYRASLQPTSLRTNDVEAEISTKDMPGFHALVIRRRIPRDGVADALSACLPAVFAYVQASGLAFAGPPLARYPETGMASVVIEGGMPVVELPDAPPAGDIEALTVPAGRAVVALHRGPYDGLPNTYIAIESYLEEHGLTASGPPWESYLTDPGERPDPATWETEVVQPVS
jgi:AraC family transcriptional regulator